ncbi:hypothetical protein Leryth_025059 [Lithospermum erythrorhizon]|nr:hypothetical protein Leryth_025059 [Lithospermum erythrorhizon]
MYQWLMSSQIERQQMENHNQQAMTELRLQGQSFSSSSSMFDHHQFPFSGEINDEHQQPAAINDDNNMLELDDQPHYYACSSSSFRLQPSQPNLQEPSIFE